MLDIVEAVTCAFLRSLTETDKRNIEENIMSVSLMDVGKVCCMHNCHQLDFLPFSCTKCGCAFCEVHFLAIRNRDILKCPGCATKVAPENRTTTEPTTSPESQTTTALKQKQPSQRNTTKCAACGNVIGMFVMKCDACAAPLCVEHRFKQHGCKEKVALQMHKTRWRRRWLMLLQWRRDNVSTNAAILIGCVLLFVYIRLSIYVTG